MVRERLSRCRDMSPCRNTATELIRLSNSFQHEPSPTTPPAGPQGAAGHGGNSYGPLAVPQHGIPNTTIEPEVKVHTLCTRALVLREACQTRSGFHSHKGRDSRDICCKSRSALFLGPGVFLFTGKAGQKAQERFPAGSLRARWADCSRSI